MRSECRRKQRRRKKGTRWRRKGGIERGSEGGREEGGARVATTGDPHVRFLRWTLMVFLFPCAQLFVQQCLAGESLPPALAGRKVLVTSGSFCRVSFTFAIRSSPESSQVQEQRGNLRINKEKNIACQFVSTGTMVL